MNIVRGVVVLLLFALFMSTSIAASWVLEFGKQNDVVCFAAFDKGNILIVGEYKTLFNPARNNSPQRYCCSVKTEYNMGCITTDEMFNSTLNIDNGVQK